MKSVHCPKTPGQGGKGAWKSAGQWLRGKRTSFLYIEAQPTQVSVSNRLSLKRGGLCLAVHLQELLGLIFIKTKCHQAAALTTHHTKLTISPTPPPGVPTAAAVRQNQSLGLFPDQVVSDLSQFPHPWPLLDSKHPNLSLCTPHSTHTLPTLLSVLEHGPNRCPCQAWRRSHEAAGRRISYRQGPVLGPCFLTPLGERKRHFIKQQCYEGSLPPLVLGCLLVTIKCEAGFCKPTYIPKFQTSKSEAFYSIVSAQLWGPGLLLLTSSKSLNITKFYLEERKRP